MVSHRPRCSPRIHIKIDFRYRRGVSKLLRGRSSLAEYEPLLGERHMLQTHAGRTGSTVAPAGWTSEPAWIHLRSAGVSLLLQVPRTGLPVVRHWGADLGPLEGSNAAAALDALLLNGAPEERPYPIIPGFGEAGRLGLL